MSLTLLDNQTRASPGTFFPQLGSGGGGGGSGSNFSSITVSSIIGGDGGALAVNAIGGFFVNEPGIFMPSNGLLSFQDLNGALNGVSSINGSVYPPAGTNSLWSSFTVNLPANSSTLLCEMPIGQFGYNLATSGGGAGCVNTGIGAQDKIGAPWVGVIGADASTSTAGGASPYVPFMSTNATTAGLISLGIANPTGSLAQCVGAIRLL